MRTRLAIFMSRIVEGSEPYGRILLGLMLVILLVLIYGSARSY